MVLSIGLMKKQEAEHKMLFRKTRDIIIETATLVKGVAVSQSTMLEDFKSHIADEEKKIDGLYEVIKKCSEHCSQEDRFNDYIKDANGTLKRIEKKQDDNHTEAKRTKLQLETRQDDYLKKLQIVQDEVKRITTAKKTFREIMGDIGKVAGIIILLSGLVVGIIRYCEAKKTNEDMKIEKLLDKIIEEQSIEKKYREAGKGL
jgi:hypothetical protein